MRNNKAYFSKQTAYSTEIVGKTVFQHFFLLRTVKSRYCDAHGKYYTWERDYCKRHYHGAREYCRRLMLFRCLTFVADAIVYLVCIFSRKQRKIANIECNRGRAGCTVHAGCRAPGRVAAQPRCQSQLLFFTSCSVRQWRENVFYVWGRGAGCGVNSGSTNLCRDRSD